MGTVNNPIKEKHMTTTSATAIKNQVQEATETAAQTKAEAAKGDHQAVQKLARQKATQATQTVQTDQTTQTSQQSADIVDSNRGKLNTKA